MASSDIGPLLIISDKFNFKMASSDRTPQYRKEENLILMVCLQEQLLE